VPVALAADQCHEQVARRDGSRIGRASADENVIGAEERRLAQQTAQADSARLSGGIVHRARPPCPAVFGSIERCLAVAIPWLHERHRSGGGLWSFMPACQDEVAFEAGKRVTL
jgi:hypothetical protein